MDLAEYDQWRAYSVGEYAKDKKAALGISDDEAMALSQESFTALLPVGLETAD